MWENRKRKKKRMINREEREVSKNRVWKRIGLKKSNKKTQRNKIDREKNNDNVRGEVKRHSDTKEKMFDRMTNRERVEVK